MTKLTPLLQSLRMLWLGLGLGLMLAGALSETLTPLPIAKED